MDIGVEGNRNFDAPDQNISGEFHLLSTFKDMKHSRGDGLLKLIFSLKKKKYIYIQSVTGGTDQTSGECSLGQTIPI